MKLVIAALAVLILVFAPAASARQDDPRLDALFARLTAAANFGEARPIEREIWTIWIEAGPGFTMPSVRAAICLTSA